MIQHSQTSVNTLKKDYIENLLRALKKNFNIRVGGSYKLYKDNFLDFDDVSDIDIIVDSNNRDLLIHALKVVGFEEDENAMKLSSGYKNKRCVLIQDYPQGFTIIFDIMYDARDLTTLELFQYKFDRLLPKDKRHLKKMLSRSPVDLRKMLSETTIPF